MRFIDIIKLMAKIATFLRKKRRVAFPEPSTKYVLTVWKKSLLDENWHELIDDFDVISVKAVDGDHLYRSAEVREIVDISKELGKDVDLWGFHYCRSEEEARAEAQAASKACAKFNPVGYHWNAEKHWAHSDDPQTHAKVFAQTFKSLTPHVELYANSFSEQTTSEVLDFFDYFEPMCYGTKRSTIAKKIKKHMSRGDLPPNKKTIMVGTGRMEEGRDDRAWGYLYQEDSEPGLLQLVARHQPLYVNFFRAGVAGGEDIMLEPNTINPILNNQVKRLKSYQFSDANSV